MKLDHSHPLPLHAQLKNELTERINNGHFPDRLPSEREFMDEYEVSRSTVREAISQLVKEGVLIKRRGVGTFVSPKPIQEWLGSLKSTTETIKEMNLNPDVQLITHGPVDPPEKIQELTEEEKVYFIKRLRFADGYPIAIENDFYPLEIGEQLAKYDLNTATIYDLLENELLLRLNKAKQTITSGKIPIEDANLLQVDDEESMLISDRFVTSSEGQWIEFSNGYFRPDMYSFSIDLERKNG